MSDKLAATFHGGSGTPVFITVVGAGTPTLITEAAKEALVHLGWNPPQTRSRIEELLDEVFHPEAHDHWLNHPMNRFGGRTPQELIENGESSDVEAYLNALAEGVVL